MKNKEIVQELIEQLKNQADSDFELHRIEVLERDLFNPPKVEQIDETHQKFDGVTYRKERKSNHYRNSFGLHQVVCRYYYGEIPPHITVETFMCENCGKMYEAYNAGNNRFCSTDCLKEFHAKIKKCLYCGKKFKDKIHGLKFCSRKCYEEWRRENYLLHHTKICETCGKEFIYDKDREQKYCSFECRNKSKNHPHR